MEKQITSAVHNCRDDMILKVVVAFKLLTLVTLSNVRGAACWRWHLKITKLLRHHQRRKKLDHLWKPHHLSPSNPLRLLR